MKNKSKKVHITIVELLCIIIIFGLSILMGLYGLNSLLIKKNNNSKEISEDSIITSCKKYLKNNSDKYPKNIGDCIDITYEELNDNNLINKNLKYLEKNNCIEKSFVKVYKDSNGDYKYNSFLYCKDTEIEDNSLYPRIDTSYIGLRKENDYYNINNTVVYTKIDGGVTPQNIAIGLDKYYYKISIIDEDDNYIDVYTSKKNKVKKQEDIFLEIKISDYIEQEKIKDLIITTTAYNNIGKTIEKISNIGNN